VASLRLRSREFKELEIVVLRHELAVVRRQISRPRLDERDRVFVAAAGQLLGRASRSLFVRPDTLLGWHRQLVRRRWTYAGRRPGRPAVSEEICELVLRLARENPRWGYQRIVGELAGLCTRVSATTVAKILRQAGVSPAGARAQLSWRDFLQAHADSIIACDFFTVETLWLGRLSVLFFLELGSRRVHFAGCTANPDGRSTAQQARQVAWVAAAGNLSVSRASTSITAGRQDFVLDRAREQRVLDLQVRDRMHRLRAPDGLGAVRGFKTRVHAAAKYSWMSPPRRSWRSIVAGTAAGESGRIVSGGTSASALCGRSRL
jgi:hypothetical protein